MEGFIGPQSAPSQLFKTFEEPKITLTLRRDYRVLAVAVSVPKPLTRPPLIVLRLNHVRVHIQTF